MAILSPAQPVVHIHPQDEVMVALQNLPAGARFSGPWGEVVLPAPVPAKHKFLLLDKNEGETVKMYGVTVGKATTPLAAGTQLTTANLHHAADAYDIGEASFTWEAPEVDDLRDLQFMGYHRPDGQVGTANYWLVVPLVFCENRNIMALQKAFSEALGYARPDPYTALVQQLKGAAASGAAPEAIRNGHWQIGNTSASSSQFFPNLDGIRFLTHAGGCGGTRQDARDLAGLLAGYIHHPNVAGATVLSLGCQHTQIDILHEEIAKRTPQLRKPLHLFEQQAFGTETALLQAAIRDTFAGMMEANEQRRAPASLRHLRVGVECGGSDGFSGISANPAMGRAADLLVALGGTVILSEFPELCGVEQDLIRRCTSPEIAQEFVTLMRRYQGWAEAVGSGFDMNPSPGNIRDGLITDAMKSAGAAKKGGTSPVTEVLDYPEYSRKPGLSLLCTPGNDVESTTALAAAGAQVILFSTGLGTPTGNPLAAVIKVSTNTTLASKMPDIIDYDAGKIITGEKTIEAAGEELLRMVAATASGEYEPCAERLGQYDFIPWKRGVSL